MKDHLVYLYRRAYVTAASVAILLGIGWCLLPLAVAP